MVLFWTFYTEEQLKIKDLNFPSEKLLFILNHIRIIFD